MVTTSVDIRGFEAVISALSSGLHEPARKVTIAETAAILQQCLKWQVVVDEAKTIDIALRKFNQFSLGNAGKYTGYSTPKISHAPRKGRVWWVESGPKFYIMGGGNRRWSDERWSRYQSEDNDRIRGSEHHFHESLKRRLLPKQAWYNLAITLGYKVIANQAIIRASAHGRKPITGEISTHESGAKFSIEGEVWSMGVIRKGGGAMLGRAVQGRIKYFERNLHKGTFDHIEHIQRAYPKLFTIRK